MKDGQGRTISASSAAAEIMVYDIQGLGTGKDEALAWLKLYALLGLSRGSLAALAVRREIYEIAKRCDPGLDPDGFMEQVKNCIREYVRAEY